MKEKDDDVPSSENNINNENQEYTEVKREITTEIEAYKVKVKDNNQYLNVIKNKNKLNILNDQGKLIEFLKLNTFEKIMRLAGEDISDSLDKISFAIYSNEEVKIFEGKEIPEKSEKNEITETFENFENESNIKLKAKKVEPEKNENSEKKLVREDILKKIIEDREKEKEREDEKYSTEDKFVIFASLASLIVYLSQFISG